MTDETETTSGPALKGSTVEGGDNRDLLVEIAEAHRSGGDDAGGETDPEAPVDAAAE